MALTFEAAVSLLQDTVCTVSYTAGTGDTGVLSSFSTSTIFNIDKADIKRSATKSDHSGGQNPEMIMRTSKYNTEATIEMKLYADVVQPALVVDLQVRFVSVVSLAGHTGTLTVYGIISDVGIGVSGPSTYKIDIKPYAVGGAASFTWAVA